MLKLPPYFFSILLFLPLGGILADERLDKSVSPETFLEAFIEAFNAQDAKILKKVFNEPLIRATNGKVTSYSSWNDYIDYQKIKSTGWVKSIINSSSVPFEDEDSAVLKMNFSRLDSAGKTIVRSDVTYLLIKTNKTMWKIATVIIPTAVPVSTGD